MRQTLINVSQVLSVLLVFLGIIFDLNLRKANQLLDIEDLDLPKEGESRRVERFKRKRKLFLAKRWIPTLVAFLIFMYLLFPVIWKILWNSQLSLFNFDIIKTLYIFIWLLIFCFFLWSVFVCKKLIKQIYKYS